MIIRNDTYEPLAVRITHELFDDELVELEPGQEEAIDAEFVRTLVIEESRTPHLVTQVGINEN